MVPSYKEPTTKEQLKFELGLNQECPEKAGLPSVQAKPANKTTQPGQIATVQATNLANHVQVTHLINCNITDKAEAGAILVHAAWAYIIHACMSHASGQPSLLPSVPMHLGSSRMTWNLYIGKQLAHHFLNQHLQWVQLNVTGNPQQRWNPNATTSSSTNSSITTLQGLKDCLFHPLTWM